jgi:hypothetical protein
MHARGLVIAGILLVLGGLTGCGGGESQERIVATYPMDDLKGLVQSDGELSIDPEESVDGRGSLHVDASEKRVVRLYEIDNPDVENCRLVWTAHLKCIGIFGGAFLEMWLRLPGEGEYFSRGLDTQVQRATDWTESETHFDIPTGKRPDRIRLNLVVGSGGHVWVDSMRVVAYPLPKS